MADLRLLGLIFLCPLLTGTTGEFTYMFISPGGNIILPCNNTLSDCTSTTWIYTKYWPSSAEELFSGGPKKNNIQRSERLSLGSDCSLIIYKTTAQDYGQYTCQQFMNGQKQGHDASVFLNVLKISPSSTQTEIRPGSSLTLSCQLFSYESCAHLVDTERVQLVWENQAGVNLQNDARYHILSSGQCNSSLTTTLLNEDNNRELRCLIKTSDEIKTSATYTVIFRAGLTSTVIPTPNPETFSSPNTPITSTQHNSVGTNPPVTPTISETTSSTNAEGSKTHVSLYRVIILIVEISVLAAPTVILLQIICAGRAENRRKTQTI